MKKIDILLKEKNVKIDDLPQNIKTAIENSELLFDDIQTMESSLTDESTDEEREELANMKETHEDFNVSILGAIENYQEEVEKKKNSQTPKPVAANEPPVPPTPPAPPAPKAEEKKKGIGFGTFIIGAAVLIATAGAVNMMRNKN